MLIKAESGARGRIDWGFVLAAGGLLLLGTIALLSAASPVPYYAQLLKRHFTAMILGSLLFVFGLGFNYQIFEDQAKVVYGFVLSMLIGVLVFGTVQRGHKSWFHLGLITFQPAELARIGLILTLAAFLDFRSRRIHEFSTIMGALAVACPLMALILKQPDFSSTLTFFPILIGMLFASGVTIAHLLGVMGFGLTALSMPLIYTICSIRYAGAPPSSLPGFILQTSHLGLAAAAVLAGAAVLSFLAWRLSVLLRGHVKPVYFLVFPVILAAGMVSGTLVNRQLKGYQRNRFIAYVAPRADIQGAAYHVRQSQIAIGSGGVFGKGLFAGTQSQLGFLPERHTDFIYSVVGEEMGFVGTMSILALYLLLIWRIVAAGRLARDRYGYLVCSGLAVMFGFELVLNVGMCLGLMPVAGIPLPLISYGGSSLVITLWALGIVANIYSRRYALL